MIGLFFLHRRLRLMGMSELNKPNYYFWSELADERHAKPASGKGRLALTYGFRNSKQRWHNWLGFFHLYFFKLIP